MVINHNANSIKKMNGEVQECHLDELGYYFVKKCIKTIETRGLDDQGLYRIGGVNSRVSRLLQMCLDRKNYNPATGRITMPDFSDPVEWETKTITSALKNYLRNLSEPLMTYDLHPSIIEAASKYHYALKLLITLHHTAGLCNMYSDLDYNITNHCQQSTWRLSTHLQFARCICC